VLFLNDRFKTELTDVALHEPNRASANSSSAIYGTDRFAAVRLHFIGHSISAESCEFLRRQSTTGASSRDRRYGRVPSLSFCLQELQACPVDDTQALLSRIHCVRNEERQAEILERIRSAALLTRDDALITPAAMAVKRWSANSSNHTSDSGVRRQDRRSHAAASPCPPLHQPERRRSRTCATPAVRLVRRRTAGRMPTAWRCSAVSQR
jgi:hypothetical protein